MKKIFICGVDEAGRGAFAGPLVTAAVVFNSNFDFKKVTNLVVKDSKELTNKKRLEIFKVIINTCEDWAFETISVEDINNRGINWANLEGFARLIKKLKADEYIIDGRWKLENVFKVHGVSRRLSIRTQIGGDRLISSVMAAGIIAKVERDKIMCQLHELYPEYKWNTNTGHGTKYHIEAIIEFGETEFHRNLYVQTGLRNYRKRGYEKNKQFFGLGKY